MKKFLVILVLAVGGAAIGYGAWRVATGRGLWPETGKPVAGETKQPETKQPDLKQPEAKQAEAESTARTRETMGAISEEALKAARTDPNIVALIGDYVITRGELEKQLMIDLQPYDYAGYGGQNEPTDAKAVLTKMVAEKAMIMEGRRQGVLETEMIYNAVKKEREGQLVNLLTQQHLAGKLTVSDAEIQAKMKADPKLDRARAEQAVKRTKANAILGRYFSEIHRKSDVKKATANFTKAAEIHQRLLLKPIVERKVAFIRNSQIRDELTEAEKNILMATFKGGKVTLKDWFMALGDMSPPRRPRDLNTAQGVDRLLEQALRTPILVAEAVALGLDKNEELRKQVKEYEDRNLLGDARQRKGKEVPEPTTEELKAYFDGHKEEFRENRKLRADQIWCLNLKTAQAAKKELDDGKDFASVKLKYTLDKESKASDMDPTTESYFWPDLWKGDPNTIVGPVKGMHRNEFRWRIVKILEKHPGTIPEFSEKLADGMKWKVLGKKRREVIEKYHRELLRRYPYKIYRERIEDIDPLDIP